MKNVLFVAGLAERYYYEPFIVACENRVNVFVFDPTIIPRNGALSIYLSTDGNLSGFIDTFRLNGENTENVRLSLCDIQTAWYLRENIQHQNQKHNSLERRFADNESYGAVRSLLSALDCKWINKKETVEFLSSNKLYQQKVALEAGLVVPPTLVSNSPEDVVNFSKHCNGLLLKTIGYIKLDDDGKYFLYSNRFTHTEIQTSDRAIHNAPVFAQKYIEKLYEHRVMVIGNRVLSCRINSQASQVSRIDWRHYDFEKVAHDYVVLPEDIQHKLLCFMSKIGLRYGAIDLIETPSGEFVFLEINPSGQWGWIHDLAGLPIPEAVAEMLESI
ncbi:MAG: hypothetical protein AAB392_01850 [Patescibacteria group bacterium]